MFKQFLRTGTCRLGLGLVLFLGLISIITGKQFLNDQEKVASEVVERQLDHIKRNIEFHSDDLGLLLYYLKFTLVNEHDPLSALAIGQKDLNPSVQHVKILTLEGQKYDTDLVNPTKLLYGNLDLSFVLIYVFPLLIIAFTFNLRSEEEETGTWKIVSVMSKSNLKFLLSKLLVRLILLVLLMSFLYLVASIVLNISWGELSFAFFVVGFVYILFWFALSFWIISLKRASNFNALVLLSFWLMLVILSPSVVNTIITNRLPVPEALTTMIRQRDGYHQKWDMDKRGTMEKFYDSYPQFETYGYPPEEGFSWLWYYAMQHLGDEESREESLSMRTKIMQRANLSRKWAKFVPSMHTQLAFNDIAGTGLINHLNFLQHTNTFHENTRLYFYPKIFSNGTAEDVDWDQFKPVYFEDERSSFDWLGNLIPLCTGIVFFFGLSGLSIRNNM
ncbi:DUF3526 domain-containing protein [Fulvivirga sp. M361]|uniref:DUF3526 domain-containing protein n=1 Tax=Fulvivirga sp. M361 TaxID=2594266 RepID=UPI0021034BDC|nr:DUF3526 domain-containing protein [Fulvivirga sp. M361]